MKTVININLPFWGVATLKCVAVATLLGCYQNETHLEFKEGFPIYFMNILRTTKSVTAHWTHSSKHLTPGSALEVAFCQHQLFGKVACRPTDALNVYFHTLVIMSVAFVWTSLQGADVTSPRLSEARGILTFLPASFHPHPPVCPLSCALWPHDASLSWQAFRPLAQLLGVCAEILCMCQLLLQQTQNRWLTATRMWACRAKMCRGEWQDHPVPEVKHKGD